MADLKTVYRVTGEDKDSYELDKLIAQWVQKVSMITYADYHAERFVWTGGEFPRSTNGIYFSLSSDHCKWSVSISTNASERCFILE